MPVWNPGSGSGGAASPDLTPVYKTLSRVSARWLNGTGAGTYLFGGGAGDPYSTNPIVLIANGLHTFQTVDVKAADFAVAGKTAKLNLLVEMFTGSTAPAITYTVGLYPLAGDAAGAANQVAFSRGAVVAGSTAVITTPAAGSLSRIESGDFTLPADGSYAFGHVTSGLPNGSSSVSFVMTLRVRHV